ncbi:MAG: hypothetical protein WCC84_08135 [Candidatus Cybelea sp.]
MDFIEQIDQSTVEGLEVQTTFLTIRSLKLIARRDGEARPAGFMN